MFTSKEWIASINKWAKQTEVRKLCEIILKTTFWKRVTYALKIFKTIVLVLLLVDGERPIIGYIYDVIDHAREGLRMAWKTMD